MKLSELLGNKETIEVTFDTWSDPVTLQVLTPHSKEYLAGKAKSKKDLSKAARKLGDKATIEKDGKRLMSPEYMDLVEEIHHELMISLVCGWSLEDKYSKAKMKEIAGYYPDATTSIITAIDEWEKAQEAEKKS